MSKYFNMNCITNMSAIYILTIETFCILLATTNVVINPNQNNWLNSLIPFIKKDPNVNRIVLLINSTTEVVPQYYIKLCEQFVQEIPSFVLDVNNDSKILENEKMLKIFSYKFHNQAAIYLFMIPSSSDTILEQLKNSIEFMINYGPDTMRPYCLLISMDVITHEEVEEFFRFSWAQKFLNIAVIQLMRQPIINKRSLTENVENIRVFVHDFNPFIETYTSNIFSPSINWFPEKLHNLQGYTLNVGFIEFAPYVVCDENTTESNIENAIYGSDISITKNLAKSMNFSVTIKVADTLNEKVKKIFNATAENVVRALDEGWLDFSINLLVVAGVGSLENYSHEFSTLLEPLSFHIIVKQYGACSIDISKLIIIGIKMVVIFTFILTICKRLLKLNKKYWTILNVFKVMIGSPIKFKSQKEIERIFFIGLVLTSFVCSVGILKLMTNVYFCQGRISRFKTLKDFDESNIIPSFTNSTKDLLVRTNLTTIQNIAKKSSPLSPLNGDHICIISLLSYEKSVNACVIDRIFGKQMMMYFQDNENGYFLTIVKEKLQPGWAAMAILKTSPYTNRFSEILRRFFEAGLLRKWYDESIILFLKNNGRLRSIRNANNDFVFNLLAQADSANEMKTKLILRMIFILIFGYSIGFLVFICELVWVFVLRNLLKKY